jgi:hypothetical protein
VTAMTAVPYLAFVIGAFYAWNPDGETWIGAAVGAVFGGIVSLVGTTMKIRQRNRREALAQDED